MSKRPRETPDYRRMKVSDVIRGLGFTEKLGFVTGAIAGALIALLHRFGLIFDGLKFEIVYKWMFAVVVVWMMVAYFIGKAAKRNGWTRSDIDLPTTIAAVREEPRTLRGFFVIWSLSFLLSTMAVAWVLGALLMIKFRH
jgi:hypothetical protein